MKHDFTNAGPELYKAAKMLENLMKNFGEDFQIETNGLGATMMAEEMIRIFKRAIAKAENK